MDVVQKWQDAEQLGAQGNVARARALYLQLIDEPSVASYAHLRLAVADQQVGNVRGAVFHALEAFGKANADPMLLEMLCKLLLQLGETHAALACANALPAVRPSAGALAEVGKMLSDHMLPSAALALLQRAMAAGMSDAPAMQYLLGLNLMYVGEFESAVQALEASLRGNPSLAPAHWALAKLASSNGRGARIGRLKRLLTGSAGGEPLLWYSLFHELDGEDECGAAWNALETALRLRRRQVHYDEVAQKALFVEAERALQLPMSKKGMDAAGSMPIFVVGLPRSGTTVIEQAICAQADVASAGELRDLAVQMRWVAQRAGSYHVDAELLRAMAGASGDLLGQRYLGHTQWRARGQAFYADKWPENYLAVGHILAALPRAKVVCVRRAAADVCFSNLKEWFASSYAYSYAQDEVARQCARYDNLLDKISAISDSRVMVVDYESFVDGPNAAIKDIKSRLDLPDRTLPVMHDAVPTASAVQVREKINSRHIGQWKRYATRLVPMLDELSRCGYSQGVGGEA